MSMYILSFSMHHYRMSVMIPSLLMVTDIFLSNCRCLLFVPSLGWRRLDLSCQAFTSCGTIKPTKRMVFCRLYPLNIAITLSHKIDCLFPTCKAICAPICNAFGSLATRVQLRSKFSPISLKFWTKLKFYPTSTKVREVRTSHGNIYSVPTVCRMRYCYVCDLVD